MVRSHCVAALVVCVACSRAASFVCADDSECASDTGAGFCEADGFCSFFDPECESERRYSDHAGNGLAGTCVSVAGTTGAQGSSTDGTSSEADEGTTESGDVDDGSTLALGSTGDSDDTTGGSTSGSSTAATGDSSGSSDGTDGTGTTGTPVSCLAVDDFEDDAIDPMWSVLDPEYVSELEGAIVFELEPPMGGYPALRLDLFDIADSTITVEVGSTSSSIGAQSMFTLRDATGDAHAFVIQPDDLLLRRLQDGAWEDLVVLPWDDAAHHWLQYRTEGGELSLEVSSDGTTFDTLHTEPFDGAVGWETDLAATDWADLPDIVAVSFLHFAFCEL